MKSLSIAAFFHLCLTISAAKCTSGTCLEESDETSLIQLSQKVAQHGSRGPDPAHEEAKVERHNLMHSNANQREASSLLEKSSHTHSAESKSKIGPDVPIFTSVANTALGDGWASPDHWYSGDVHKPSWFGGFNQGESTYTIDGEQAGPHTNPLLPVQDGWYPQQIDPVHHILNEAEPSNFFWESPSGDYQDAFQTFYPASGDNIAGSRVLTGDFYTNLGGVLHQQYMDSASALTNRERKIPASWFDSMERQMDGFGRHDMPSPLSPARHLTWKEQTANTSMACKTPGCTAKVNLTAPFRYANDTFANCRVSVFFHPTDFDDHYSGEAVEYITVNHMRVANDCRPNMMDGCNDLAQRPLIPCVQDFPIDHLIDLYPQYQGTLMIEAKIRDTVDECPYYGNLLSAVPTVTCLVNPKPPPLKFPPLHNMSRETMCKASAPLQCATRGCQTETTIPIDAECITGGHCKLTIMTTPTDFDNEDGSKEFIEWISVGGIHVANNINPGANPCKQEWQMAKNSDNGADILKHGLTSYVGKFMNYSFPAIANLTINVPKSGMIVIGGKISDAVDECAANGYLFDSIASVQCERHRIEEHFHKDNSHHGRGHDEGDDDDDD